MSRYFNIFTFFIFFIYSKNIPNSDLQSSQSDKGQVLLNIFYLDFIIFYSQLNLKQYIMWYNLFMAYSIDFRKKVLAYCERTGSITEASHIFQISRNTIYGWLKLKEKTGELNHQVKGTKPRKVDRDRLKNYLTNNPDAYLTEIASEFGCHPTTIHYALKAMGYTRKKRITPTMNKTQKK